MTIAGQRAVPALLHICHESREEGLRYYTPLEDRFYGQSPRRTPYYPQTIIVYANFATDLFVFFKNNLGVPPFGYRYVHGFLLSSFNFSLPAMAQIRHVAINSQVEAFLALEILDLLLRMHSVESLTLIRDVYLLSSLRRLYGESHDDYHQRLRIQARTVEESVGGTLARVENEQFWRDDISYHGLLNSWEKNLTVNFLWRTRKDVDLSAWSGDIERYQVYDVAFPNEFYKYVVGTSSSSS